MSKSVRRHLCLFASLIALSAPAAGQRIERIVAFGDSYADDGNAIELGLVPPQLLPLYPTGRFTGGTNYVDTLSQLLDAPVFNFAIGGARANPDFLFEIGAFAAGGGSVFPTISPIFDETDLVTVSIGGNDARAYGSLPGASVAGAPAAAAPAIAATQAGLNVLVAAGAPTVSFLAGNTGELPEVAANPSVAAVRSAYSNAFNLGVQQVLAGYAADGVMVHYLDLSLLLDRVQSDPGAFGLTGITCPAFPNPACLLNGGNGFLFYGDLLHPTSQGSAIIARYVAAQLQAPLTFSASSDLGLDIAQQFGRTLSSRSDLGSGEGQQGLQLFLVGDLLSRNYKQTDSTDAFDNDGAGATLGAAYGFGAGEIGVAINYSRHKAQFVGDVSDARASSVQVGAFANADFGGGSVQGYVGYGSDEHDIERQGVIDNLQASPGGHHWLAGAKAGYLVPMGALRIGPTVALDYARSRVKSYTEDGDAALALNVGSLTGKSLTGSIGAELKGDLDVGGSALRPYLSAALEKEFTNSNRTVRFSQVSAPVIVNSWDIDEGSRETYGRLTGGADADILGSVGINALVSTTIGRDSGKEMSVQVGLRAGF